MGKKNNLQNLRRLLAEEFASTDVAADVKSHQDRWNPPPEDHTLERVVGVPTDQADVAATAHIDVTEINKHIDAGNMSTDSGVDAQRMYADDADDGEDADDVEDDGEDGDEFDRMDHAELKAAIDEHNAGLENEDDHLSKGGSSDDLRDRLREV